MRARTLALVVTLALAVVGCGGHHSSGSSGSGGSGSSGYGGDTTDAPTETQPAIDPGCSESAPVSVQPANAWRGFIRLCEDDESRGLLVVENISNVVLRVSGDTSRENIRRYMPAGDDLATALVAGLNWDCGPGWCPVPPGGHVDVSGQPAEAFIQIDDSMTVQVVFEKSLAATMTSRLEAARGGEGVRKVAACAQGIGGTVNAQNWQEQFRYALTSAPSCNSLRKMVFPPEDVEAADRSAAELLTKARSLSEGTWVDALVLVGTHVHAR